MMFTYDFPYMMLAYDVHMWFSVCDVCMWSLYVMFTCDDHIWFLLIFSKILHTYELHMWFSVCDVGIWCSHVMLFTCEHPSTSYTVSPWDVFRRFLLLVLAPKALFNIDFGAEGAFYPCIGYKKKIPGENFQGMETVKLFQFL